MVKHGEVTTVDKVRTRSKARDRLIELTIEKPVERLAILHSETPDIDAFRAELLKHLPDIDPERRVGRDRRCLGRTACRAGLRGRGDPLPPELNQSAPRARPAPVR